MYEVWGDTRRLHSENLRRFNELTERMVEVEHLLRGNGEPGLRTIVDRHEQTLTVMKRLGWMTIAFAFANLATVVAVLLRSYK